MSYDNFFGSFFDRVGDHEHEEMRCPNCGLEFRSFKKTGLLGCRYTMNTLLSTLYLQ